MGLEHLAAYQKRLKEWTSFLFSKEIKNHGLKDQYAEALKNYRNLIAKLWESGTINENDKINLKSAERDLESLNELMRLAPVSYESHGQAT